MSQKTTTPPKKAATNGKSRPRADATWSDLGSERVQIIIDMVKHRATLEEIGDAVRVTRERARQLINKIKKEHGEKVFTPLAKLWTTSEAAKELNAPIATIEKICAAGEIACRKRGPGASRSWLIYEAGMKVLRLHPRLKQERVCEVCDAKFNRCSTNANTCSDKCRQQLIKNRRNALVYQVPTAESLDGWLKDLWQRLQSHRIPNNEVWLTITEAAKRTGLGISQITWLRLRKIVTIRPHPVKKWRGRRVATYAASQMEIARQVFADHAKRNGKPT